MLKFLVDTYENQPIVSNPTYPNKVHSLVLNRDYQATQIF